MKEILSITRKMKKLLLLLTALQINVCFAQQERINYTRLNNDLDSLGTFSISKFRFSEQCDSTFSSLYLKYSINGTKDLNSIIFDTVGGCTPYGSEISVYYSDLFNDYLLIYAVNYEFESDIKLYYIINDNIYKAGVLPVISACENCDDIIYSLSKIKIQGTKDYIYIYFLDSLKIKTNSEKPRKFEPGQISYIFTKRSKTLKMHLP